MATLKKIPNNYVIGITFSTLTIKKMMGGIGINELSEIYNYREEISGCWIPVF
jgi:hypothetical protein